jgi:hypothetical protein
MAFHIWHTKNLAADLAGGRVSERDGLKYMLLAAVLYVYTNYWNLWFGNYKDVGFLIELSLVLIISVVGVCECYKANGGDAGEDFIVSFCALSVPVGTKIAIIGLICGQALFFGSDRVLATGAFRDPDLAYRYIYSFIAVSLSFVTYWRIAHHIGTVRASRKPVARDPA